MGASGGGAPRTLPSRLLSDSGTGGGIGGALSDGSVGLYRGTGLRGVRRAPATMGSPAEPRREASDGGASDGWPSDDDDEVLLFVLLPKGDADSMVGDEGCERGRLKFEVGM